MLTPVQGLRVNAPIQPTLNPISAPQTSSQAITELRPQDSIQKSALFGNIPASMNFFVARATDLQDALARLSAGSSQQNFRDAQAGFRVAIRKLDLPALEALRSDIKAEIANNGDFRTQRLLDGIYHDVNMQIFEVGGKPEHPALKMPPLPGNTPETVVSGTLKQLSSHMSEANFKTALAGFRVALRSLSPEQLLQTRGLVSAAGQTQTDYRAQLMLEQMRFSLIDELFDRGIKTEAPELKMPPALGATPAQIASNAVALLNSSASQANFKTALAAARVAIRGLDADQKTALKSELQSAMKQTNDYRTQIYLDQVYREIY